MEAVRGPKKKKGGDVKQQAESTDIVNIFKERQDPEINDISEYPIYVKELSRGSFSVHEFYLGIRHNNPHMVMHRVCRCQEGQI